MITARNFTRFSFYRCLEF